MSKTKTLTPQALKLAEDKVKEEKEDETVFFNMFNLANEVARDLNPILRKHGYNVWDVEITAIRKGTSTSYTS